MSRAHDAYGDDRQDGNAAQQGWAKIAAALKPVYTASTEDAATERFLEFAEAWDKKYPAIHGPGVVLLCPL